MKYIIVDLLFILYISIPIISVELYSFTAFQNMQKSVVECSIIEVYKRKMRIIYL